MNKLPISHLASRPLSSHHLHSPFCPFMVMKEETCMKSLPVQGPAGCICAYLHWIIYIYKTFPVGRSRLEKLDAVSSLTFKCRFTQNIFLKVFKCFIQQPLMWGIFILRSALCAFMTSVRLLRLTPLAQTQSLMLLWPLSSLFSTSYPQKYWL